MHLSHQPLDPASHGDFAAAQPLDAFNRALLNQVHPRDWPNPRPPADGYHLVVLGAGTGGLVTAAIAAGLGARVALIERGLMGGDCLNVGCVPSKALLRAAHAWHDARTGAARFGAPEVAGAGDFAAVMRRMRRVRAAMSVVDGAPRFRDELGVDVYFGAGAFVAPDAIEVAGARLRFRRAVISTGTRPAIPPIAGMEEAGYLTNETIFSLTELPRTLGVIGGGPVGCELAQAFARFGARVTLFTCGERLLTRDDPDAARIVTAAMRANGIEIIPRARIAAAGREGDARWLEYRAGGAGEAPVRRSFDQLLVATGRMPAVESLALERAGIRSGGAGVEVNDLLRTANPRVFAVGDVASPLRFTHLADAQARMVVRNALFHGRGRASELIVPWCTYTDPELAHVGRQRQVDAAEGVRTITIPLAEVDRARLDGAEDGFVRIHLRRGSDEITGATVVGPHAGNLISQVTQAMTQGAGLRALGEMVYPYPTYAEAFRKAADQRQRDRLTPLSRALLKLYFRALR